MTSSQTDRIEKRLLLRAPKSRVWRALTDAKEFGAWFGGTLTGEFKAGGRVAGMNTGCGHDNVPLVLDVEHVAPEDSLTLRWHPYNLDRSIDYSQEAKTKIVFTLEETAEGTLLTVVESGFDALPAARRDIAFRMHGEGWVGQLENINRYVTR